MASTAGSIVLGIFADIAQLKTDLGRANQNIDAFASKATHSLTTLTKMATGFASAFAGIGLGLGAAGFASLIKSTTDAADQLGDLSDRLGISTDMLQAYQYAAKDAGSSTETVSTAFAKFNQLLGEATAGEDEAIKLFARLGIATKDAAGNAKTTEAAFRELADKIQAAGSVADKTAIAKKFLGKAGAELVPIFAQGAAGADKMVVSLREMGLLAEGDMIRQYDGLAKEFDKISKAMSVAMMEAIITLKPQLLSLGDAFITAARGAAKLFEWFTPDSIASLDLLARRVKETREQIDREIAGRAKGGVEGWIFGLGSAKREADFRKREADLMDYADKAREDAAKPPLKLGGGGLGDDPDKVAAAAKKAAAEAKKIRDKWFADTIAEEQFKETAREQRDIAANKQAEIDRKLREDDVAGAYRTLQEKLAYEAMLTAAHWEEHDKRRKVVIATEQAETAAAYQAVLDQLAIDKAGEDQRAEQMARNTERVKEEAEKRAAAFKPIADRIDGLFGAVERAFSTSVSGVIQGTITLEKAFANMGQSIAISLGETAVKEGVDALKKALKELLQSQMVQQLIRTGIGALGGMFGAGAGVTVAPVQNINVGSVPMAAAGGIVQSPTFAVVGEAGPEAIVPLDRWGEMGGNVTVNIIDQRREGNVQTQEKTTASGERQVDVLITDVVRAGLAGGSYDRALGGSFGLSRRGVQR